MDTGNEERVKEEVRKRYTAALASDAGCCGDRGGEIGLPPDRVVCSAGYRPEELKTLPAEAVVNSFGCGNPLAFLGVREGDVVVDIGSGAGMDCLLAAQKVGRGGKVIGLDMTPAMVETARRNAERAGARQVEFRLGEAENMPVESGTADWIISNCVINLSPNKPKVFREAFRVLRPGGRVSISDIMVEKLPWILRRSASLYTSCISGAIPEKEYLEGLRASGFQDVRVTERNIYDTDQILGLMGELKIFGRFTRLFRKPLAWIVCRYLAGKIWSARVVAVKPEGTHVAN